ncbi:cytochrome c oxidase subunit II (plasmid) [Limimaricola variabilis]
MIVAASLVLIVLFSVGFHLFSPWWWTPIASNWGYIDTTLVITFWITGAVFVAVVLFMAWCVFRYRHKPGRVAHYEPESRKLEIWLIALTALGVAAMLAPGLVVWKRFITVPDDATEIEVVAQQWYWSYRLPGVDGRLGSSGTEWIDFDNPLGINPHDRFGADDVVIDSGDLHLPLGQPVRVNLRSVDVLHDFYVPEFRAKMDMVPGMVTYFWFTPTRTGEFEVLCAELCGVGHGVMRGYVSIDEPEDFDSWLGEQVTFAGLPAGGAVRVAETAEESDP